MNDNRPIEVGGRFEDGDPRQGNRVIRIVEAPIPGYRVKYRIEVAELNPATVGREHWIHPRTLKKRYRRISR
jgi:hypothetical protein